MRRLSLILIPLLIGAAGGCAVVEPAVKPIGRTYDFLSGKTPSYYARKMENAASADERIEGINYLADRDFGRRDPYTKRYIQIAQNDPDPMVRAVAIRALNRARHRPAVPLLVEKLSDPNEQIRLEATKALANMPDPRAIDPLIQLLRNEQEDKDLRIAAADALRHYPRIEVARVLAGALPAREFGVAWQAHRSLVAMTGRNLRYDEGAWLTYLTGPEKPFG